MNEYEKWEQRRREWHIRHTGICAFVWALLLGTGGVYVGAELWGVPGLFLVGFFGAVTGGLLGAGMAYEYHPDRDSNPRKKAVLTTGLVGGFILYSLVEWLRLRSL